MGRPEERRKGEGEGRAEPQAEAEAENEQCRRHVEPGPGRRQILGIRFLNLNLASQIQPLALSLEPPHQLHTSSFLARSGVSE